MPRKKTVEPPVRTEPARPQRRSPAREPEPELPQRGYTPLLAAIACFALSLGMFYTVFAQPEALYDAVCLMRSFGGSLFWLLPVWPMWAGYLCLRVELYKPSRLLDAIVEAVLLLSLFTIASLTAAPRLEISIHTYFNFLSQFGRQRIGGGLLGALIAYPLFTYLGTALGCFAVAVIAVLLLTANGAIPRLISLFAEYLKEQRELHEEEAAAEADDYDIPDDEDPFPVRRKAPPLPVEDRPQRDPLNATIQAGSRARQLKRKPEELPQDFPDDAEEKPAPRASRSHVNADNRALFNGHEPDTRAPEMPPISRDNNPFDVQNEPKKPRKKRFEEQPAPVESEDIASETDIRRPRRRVGGPESPMEEVPSIKKPRRSGDPDTVIPEHLYVKERTENGDIRIHSVRMTNPANLFEVHEEPERDKRGQSPFVTSVEEKPVEPAEPAAPVVKPPVKKQQPKPSFFDNEEDLTIQPDTYEFPDVPEHTPKKTEPAPKPRFNPPKTIIESSDYIYPDIDLLAKGESVDVSIHREKDMEKAHLLEETLQSFGIQSRLTGIAHGPAVTRFELAPAPGVKVSRITSLSDDIALNLAAKSVRIEAPIPGKAAVGVEIPNDKVETVRLRDVLESPDAINHSSKIAVGMGKDNAGRYIVADLAKMPHTLIAGQTGSGKSVCINCIITSILYRAAPEEVRLILIDPKMVELSIYNDIPHLICPVVTDPKKAAGALAWAVSEMTDRYKRFAERGVRDIKGYNKTLHEGEAMMPKIVIIIDELADLMMLCRNEVEDSICRLAQLARACGMHLVIATQRPSVNVVTGIIKANIPSRIAFSVASSVDSKTMLDHGGAEMLLGNGDMLFAPSGINKPMRVQGAWVSDEEVHSIVEYIKMTSHTHYDEEMIESLENAARDAEKESDRDDADSDLDPRLMEAVDIACDAGNVSTSHLQRRMRMGYARAGRCVDVMSQLGIVSQPEGSKPRTVLVTREEAHRIVEEAMKG